MELRVGTIKAYSGGDHTCTVQLDISPVYVAGVPVSRGIAGAEVVAGRTCAVVFFDQHDVVDAMVLGVY